MTLSLEVVVLAHAQLRPADRSLGVGEAEKNDQEEDRGEDVVELHYCFLGA